MADKSEPDTVAWRDRKHGGEIFFVFANHGMTEEWRRKPENFNVGSDILQSTDVFHEGSSNADPGRASKALLAYVRATPFHHSHARHGPASLTVARPGLSSTLPPYTSRHLRERFGTDDHNVVLERILKEGEIRGSAKAHPDRHQQFQRGTGTRSGAH